MIETFIYTLTPMLYLLCCMVIGYALRKSKILPDNSGKTIARLENWVFSPALSFMTMANFCTLDTFSVHATNITVSVIVMLFALTLAIILSRVFVRKKCYDRGVYAYALMFGNFGFVGDALVIAMFGDAFYAYYKLFSLPLLIFCYVWGISILVPNDKADKGFKSLAKRIFTPPTVALLLGVVVGLTGALDYFPEFAVTTLNSLKVCMGPLAMILAGVTVAGYSVKSMLTKKKVYAATAFRLLLLPAVLIAFTFTVMKLFELGGVDVSQRVIYFVFFAYAAPLGLNTVVFPEAYGGDPETGASMALISHTLCVLTIPVLYSLLLVIFGAPPLV